MRASAESTRSKMSLGAGERPPEVALRVDVGPATPDAVRVVEVEVLDAG